MYAADVALQAATIFVPIASDIWQLNFTNRSPIWQLVQYKRPTTQQQGSLWNNKWQLHTYHHRHTHQL